MNDTSAQIQNLDIEALFRKYGPMVLRRCVHLLGDADRAADAVQEVFVKLLENRRHLKAQYPSSLLWTMATNHCLNKIRDNKRRGKEGDGDSLLERIACSSDIGEKHGARSVLRKLFHSSPESSRTIAVLHFVDGMTLEETAREVKMSVSGVRRRLAALRETLTELEAVQIEAKRNPKTTTFKSKAATHCSTQLNSRRFVSAAMLPVRMMMYRQREFKPHFLLTMPAQSMLGLNSPLFQT